ncbi:hypothetical protein FGB62_53g17 [Gracilaria domingensis]|nr:hypothetical protein FGB62_53g17 [Gracilaria domingensis]
MASGTSPDQVPQRDTPTKNNCQTKSYRDKQPQWKDVDTMATTMAIVRLPDASINDVLIPEHPELNNRQRMDVWKARSGRSVAEQGQKGLALCRKLKGCLRIVHAQQTTGNATDDDKMRCAVGLLNNVIKTSHFYDVFRNPNYVIGKAFPYPNTFAWLDTDTSELDPLPPGEDDKANNASKRMETKVQGGQAACDSDDVAQSNVEGCNSSKPGEDQSDRRKRPIGVKAAKAAKKAKRETDAEDVASKSALDSWTKGFVDASSASIEAANTRSMRESEQSHKEYLLRKEADELEAVKVLFNDEDDESRQYKMGLKRKRLRKLLKEEGMENESSQGTREPET